MPVFVGMVTKSKQKKADVKSGKVKMKENV